MKKGLLILIWTVILNLILVNQTRAADLEVNCSGELCTKTGTDPLFNKHLDGYWFPGRILAKTVLFKNSSGQTKLIAVQANRTFSPNPLEKVMQLTLTDGEKIIWVGNLSDFYSREKIDLGNFASGSSKKFAFSLNLPKNLGQEYSNLETVFDLQMGFWEENVLGEMEEPKTNSLPLYLFILPLPTAILILALLKWR